MGRIRLLAMALVFVVFAGCSQQEGKVNVIKGPGTANSSLMVSFSELCTGEAEGFAGNPDNLVVSQNNGTERVFSLVNIPTTQTTPLLSIISGSSPSFQLSPNGRKLLVNDLLYDLDESKKDYLPPVEAEITAKVSLPSYLPSYSFIGGAEPVLSNPYYYIRRYGNVLPVIALRPFEAAASRVIPAGDTTLPKASLNVDLISMPSFLPGELRYLFIGHKNASADPKLYSFDIVNRKLSQIDTGVGSYAVSPDGGFIAYVKKTRDDDTAEKLIIADANGDAKKELHTAPSIAGIAWSSSSEWLAFSAGEPSRGDVHVIKPDGSSREKLTQGMNAGGKLAWWGKRLAFTSVNNGISKVYTILLNIEDKGYLPEVQVAPEKQEAYDRLLEVLRSETLKVRKSGSKV